MKSLTGIMITCPVDERQELSISQSKLACVSTFGFSHTHTHTLLYVDGTEKGLGGWGRGLMCVCMRGYKTYAHLPCG
jgi:hypothetical protein